MGRPPICPCGTVSLWHGTVQSNQNSQQLSDWYSFSPVIHGFIFFGLSLWLIPARPLWVALALAIRIEAAWEILENSPVIIDRYRTDIGSAARRSGVCHHVSIRVVATHVTRNKTNKHIL